MKLFKTTIAVIAYSMALLSTIYISSHNEFYAENTRESLLSASIDYLGKDSQLTINPETFTSVNVGKQIVCILQDQNDKTLMGAVLFQKGWHGHYRPINAEYGSGFFVRSISTRSLISDPISRTVLYSASLPKQAKFIEILNYSLFNPAGAFLQKYITTVEIKDTPFIYIHSNSGFRDLRLLDAQGNVLSDSQYSQKNFASKEHGMSSLIWDLPLLIVILVLLLIFFIPTLLFKKSLNEKSGY